MQRYHDSLTGRAERVILRLLCARIPSWITSNHLTALGLFGAVLICLGYWLAGFRMAFYALALFGMLLNWLGDSLDGSLARYRGAERPQFGFFLDHSVDGFAMALVAGGVGLSPMAHFWCALLALASYYIVVILSLTTCLATGVFKVSFGGIGPTEVRLGIIGCTLCAIVLPVFRFNIAGLSLTVYDVILVLLSAGLVITAIIHTMDTARQLALIDPPRHPRR